jgi:pyruvate/2-oxoglutarate dehydrogenase complex dihydrolipoamide dehydrogenase (E3) component
MMGTDRFDAFVIGGGGTGSEIVSRLASAGLHVGMAERDRLGGECTWYGCVPTKIMVRSAKILALARGAGEFGVRIPSVDVDFEAVRARVLRIVAMSTSAGARPFTEHGARVIFDDVRVTGPTELETSAGERIVADRIVFASGTQASVPPIDGLQDGPYWTNKEAIWHEGGVPSSLVVIGGGPIGIEFAQIYSRFGARVTVVEAFDRVLPPEDDDSGFALRAVLEDEGISIITGATIESARFGDGTWRIEIDGHEALTADHTLVATGRRPMLDGHDLDEAGVKLEDGKPVLSDTMRTTAPNIWAAGDATGELLFTHVGGYEAKLVVDDILGRPRRRDYRVVPKVTYSDPEVASVGLSERAAREADHEVVTSTLLLKDNERAVIDGTPEGHVKLVADQRTGELLGGHIVGDGAGEMIHEIVAAMVGHVPVRTVADAIHAYPTMSETVGGAFAQLADALGR